MLCANAGQRSGSGGMKGRKSRWMNGKGWAGERGESVLEWAIGKPLPAVTFDMAMGMARGSTTASAEDEVMATTVLQSSPPEEAYALAIGAARPRV